MADPVCSPFVPQVGELYAIAQRWDKLAGTVPAVVGRLRELRGIHEQAADFTAVLKQMETTQAQVKELLEADEATMATLETSFAKNMAIIDGNFKSLEARVAAVARDMAKLR